jgi:uncharacterized protein YgiB involved in biofilm formation
MTTRRSRTIRLALMGSIGLVGTLPLASCDSPPEADAFRTAEECISKTGQDLMCREAAREAQAQASTAAPAFRSQQACEAAFGSCAPANALPSRDQADAAIQMGDTPPAAAASSTGSWFLPAAAGFLLGRAMGTPPAPYFQHRQYGAVGFGAQGTRLPIDPRAFADPRLREEQQRASGSSGGGGAWNSSRSSTTYSPARDSRPSRAYSTPSRSGGFGTTARSSSSSSGG